jgi:hypothetical protein
VIYKLRIGKDLERKSRFIITLLTQQLSGETEEKYKKCDHRKAAYLLTVYEEQFCSNGCLDTQNT